jgi:vacuole morphology and inheritance protein 14
MRLDDINYLKKMEKLLLDKIYDYAKNIKNSQNIFETIYEKFFDKVINSDLINDTQVYQIFTDIGTKLKESLVKKSNILTIFEIFGNVLTSISKKNNIIKDSKDNNNLSKNKKSDSNLINKLSFYEKIVYKLTEILLNEGISDFRHKYSNRKDKKTLFDKLYQIWAISPISVLILCISAEKFRLAYNIILNLKEIEFTDDIIGKLIIVVKYFAKDDYDYFWGKLLEPSDNIYFIKTFYGILMILPQGVAFDYLSDKLSNVNSLLLVENKIEEINSRKNSIINGKIRHFLNLQERKKKKVEK